MKTGIGLYKSLSRIKWLRSYSSKFLFLGFIGLHVPLLGIIALITLTATDNLQGITIFIYALAFTLISTIITLYLMRELLNPVRLLQRSLEDFMKDEKLPELPQGYKDEIGILMKDMQLATSSLKLLMETKNDVIELISHDLRSPASSMLGLIGVLESTRSSDKELMDYCDKLKSLVSKQLALTNGILQSLKQEERLVEGTREQVLVKTLCDSAIHTFSEEIRQKGLNVTIDVAEQFTIISDPLQMQQVINNLIHNAIKFSHHGGRISVQGHQENDRVIIVISDNGIGMDKFSPELLFKRFTKYSRSGTYGESSSGLGLFICRKIIEKHGGTITASSKGINKGTTFTVNLPLKP